MKILWVATKPAWPPTDGGRLVQAQTIEALVGLGHRVRVVAPARPPMGEVPTGVEFEWVESPSVGWGRVLLRRLSGEPLTLGRHRCGVVGAAVERHLGTADVVHVEQLQALAQVSGHRPVVLRAQNVESDLWEAAGQFAGHSSSIWRRVAFGLEAARLRRAEGRLLGRPDRAVALTAPDAARLAQLSGRFVGVVAAPFPAALPAGPSLVGDPAVAILVGRGWAPNRLGADWFVREVWPIVLASRPAARLHLFGWEGSPGPSIESHLAPLDPAAAFPAGGVVVVPVQVASGVRMKILEAWARGVAVVSTTAGALGILAPEAVSQGSSAAELAAALVDVASKPERRLELEAAGRRALRQHHDPTRVAGELVKQYQEAGRTFAG